MNPRAMELAANLDRIADLLEVQGANPHRVRAYRHAAGTAREQDERVVSLAEADDPAVLEEVPGVGRNLAGLIHEFVHTGRCPLLDRLEGQVSPEDLFSTIPGIGDQLAHRIHDQLGVETLEELEVTAHDGRLEQIPGLGPRRAAGIRASLGAILERSSHRRARRFAGSHAAQGAPPSERPSVDVLLAVDALYRERSAAGTLPTIAPRRFNPEGVSWLPILHCEREGWSFTALFSNTGRAHQLGKTRDWVVLFYEREGREDQCTVVTETRGPKAGQRVVRGRESDSVTAPPDAAATVV